MANSQSERGFKEGRAFLWHKLEHIGPSLRQLPRELALVRLDLAPGHRSAAMRGTNEARCWSDWTKPHAGRLRRRVVGHAHQRPSREVSMNRSSRCTLYVWDRALRLRSRPA